MFRVINNCLDGLKKIKDLLSDFLENPMLHGAKASYFMISVGASVWLMAFTLNFVLKMFGL